MSHGQILGGVVATPDLDAALADYAGVLGLEVVEQGALDADLCAAWDCPANEGARHAVLRPKSGAPCHIRLVEQPLPPGFRPTTSFGWASYELTVEDVFGWPGRLLDSGFRIVGEPKEIAAMPFFVPMQVLGRGEEMIYLNEVRQDMPNTDLPRAHSPVDRIFIVILAARSREESVAWYRDRLLLDVADTFTIDYTMINRAFGLPGGTLSSLTMMQKGRMPVIEIDDYPAEACARPADPGRLPPGNALVTLGVERLDALSCDWLCPPVRRDGPVYDGRRTATVRGPSSELIELVETGA